MLSTTLRALGETLTCAPTRSSGVFRRSFARRGPAPAKSSYRTPSGVWTCETEAKKSRFIASVAPCASSEEALAFVRERGDSSASHNCWAFRIGDDVYRFSDDGEPSGTAGQPIHQAIQASGLDRVCVVVTRHYGGTQLGTGGLIRAYGGAAHAVLELAAKTAIEVRAKCDAIVNCTPGDLGQIFRALDEFGAEKVDEEYSDDGSVHVQVIVEEAIAENLHGRIMNATSGKAEFKWWPTSTSS